MEDAITDRMANSRTLVIVPAFNEGITLRRVIESLLLLPVEVVLVDDGSQQPLAPLLKGLNITILRHRSNLGQGAALQTGFEFAKRKEADIVVTFDADGQHEATDIPNLVAPILQQEADIVLGSRFLPETPNRVPRSKKWVLHLARLINFLFSGIWLSDAHNGLRALNRKALDRISLTENRMAHASELLFEIKKFHLRWTERPVHIHYSDYSRKKGQSAWQSIRILFDLVLHKLFK